MTKYLLALVFLSGCVMPLHRSLPGILDRPAPGTTLAKNIPDYQILFYSTGVSVVMAHHAADAQTVATITNLFMAALSSATVGAAAGGAQPATLGAMAAVGTFLFNVASVVQPVNRMNAYNEGYRLTLDAQSRYARCLGEARVTRVSHSKLTPCGAELLENTNTAVNSATSLLLSAMPNLAALEKMKPTAPLPKVSPESAKVVNAETDAPEMPPKPEMKPMVP